MNATFKHYFELMKISSFFIVHRGLLALLMLLFILADKKLHR